MIYFRHLNSFAVIDGEWKLYGIDSGKIDMFNLENDIEEKNDLSKQFPEKYNSH